MLVLQAGPTSGNANFTQSPIDVLYGIRCPFHEFTKYWHRNQSLSEIYTPREQKGEGWAKKLQGSRGPSQENGSV